MLITISPITVYWRERVYTSSKNAKRGGIPGSQTSGYYYNACALVSRTGIVFENRVRLVLDWKIWRREPKC